MSQQNVETVRRLFAALNRGDLDELEAITPHDFELDRGASNSPDRRVYRGPKDIRRLWSNLLDAWSEFEFYEIEMIDAGHAVIRVGGIRGKGKSSGVEVAAEGATLWRFRNGKPVSARLFQSKAEALEAVGLAE